MTSRGQGASTILLEEPSLKDQEQAKAMLLYQLKVISKLQIHQYLVHQFHLASNKWIA